jgi:glycosyltransferase involved in cell wall biosynthesis
MKVLLISFFNPLEPSSGSGLRSNSLLKNLVESGHLIHLFTYSGFDNSRALKEYPGIRKSCFVECIPRMGLTTGLKTIFRLQPIALSQYITRNVARAFIRFTSGETYDAIVFDHLYTCGFRKYLVAHSGRTVINEHNAEFVMIRDYRQNQARWFAKSILFLDFLLTRRFEFDALCSVDRVIHVSDGDLEEFGADIRKKSVVIPNTLPYQLKFKRKNCPENTVMFVGAMAHRANVDGLARFVREAWGDIHNLRPDISLLIVGANPPREIRAFHGKWNIHVMGYVEDLPGLYEKSKVAIAPVYIGSGSRLKIVEAMMHSTLNIATPKGAEGLPVEDGKHIVIASSKQAWIGSILRYMDNAEERLAIEKNAHALSENLCYYRNYRDVVGRCLAD